MQKHELAAAGLLVLLATTGAAFGQALEGKPSASEILAASTVDDWRTPDPANVVYLDLEHGRVVIELSSRLAPGHVERFRSLVRRGFYDGLSFYRVIDGFVAQGGDILEEREKQDDMVGLTAEFETETGQGFVKLNTADGYADEVGFVDDMPAGRDRSRGVAWLLHCTGAVAFARGEEKDTATTEFYITLQPQRYLDRNLSVIGRVIDGMEHIQTLRRVSPAGENGRDMGEKIVSIRLEADIPETDRKPLSTFLAGTGAFKAYIEARRNRPESFFRFRPDYVDICQLPLPVQAAPAQ